MIGATLPGVPGVVLGRNEHIAWGFTNTGPDVQDLYIERWTARAASSRRRAGSSSQVVEEMIKVKGASRSDAARARLAPRPA